MSQVNNHKWGKELVWAMQPGYVAKILLFENKNAKTDLRFHSDANKTFFINNGKFLLRFIDTQSGKLLQKELKEGDVYHAPPLHPHSWECLETTGSINEVSNSFLPTDVFTVISANNIK
jgi:hypothetical protein|tara:strand:+ start:33930 stop:34286 length:357 start_codon:yes stop_codon:yes gene_type:complete